MKENFLDRFRVCLSYRHVKITSLPLFNTHTHTHTNNAHILYYYGIYLYIFSKFM